MAVATSDLHLHRHNCILPNAVRVQFALLIKSILP